MNLPEPKRFLAWPGWRHLGESWFLALLVTVWFAFLFVGTNTLTAHRATRVNVHLPAELRMPLVPGFTVVYSSLYLLFLAAPFVLRTRREILRLALTLGATIFIASIGFLLIPAQLAYPPPTDQELGAWKPLFLAADRLNLDYNLVPSLHVALAIVCLETFSAKRGTTGKIVARLWGLLLAASTLLTHQHHLIDVITGYGLALIMVQLDRRRNGARLCPKDQPQQPRQPG